MSDSYACWQQHPVVKTGAFSSAKNQTATYYVDVLPQCSVHAFNQHFFMRKILCFLLLAIFFVAGACKKKTPDTPVTLVPERLELSPAASSVIAGSSATFTITYYNNRGNTAAVPAGIVWSSNDNSIATVNQQGIVTGLAAGQTSIKITLNNISATALITVTAATVPERLAITSVVNSILTGTTTSLTLTYFNNQGIAAPVPQGVVWSSSNNAVATVNQQGVVTGIAAGTANIIATLNSINTSIAITVTNPAIPERLEIAPGNANIFTGTTAVFTVTYYNSAGVVAPVPPGVIWSSLNTAVATVNQQGVVTGVGAGQTTVRATLNSIQANATVTVTANQQLATIVLSPSALLEVNLNQTAPVTATGRNSSGDIINGLVFTWASSNNSLVTVDNTGLVRGVAYGTANVTATSASVSSPPLMVQVIRSGNFNGAFGSTGQAKLKIENGVLKLETSVNFSVSTGAPDLRIYLSASTTSIANSVEVATLNQRFGMQSWNVPAISSQGQPVNITTFPFVLVWCKQFGGNYGHVVLP